MSKAARTRLLGVLVILGIYGTLAWAEIAWWSDAIGFTP
jgi:hypothetical protein